MDLIIDRETGDTTKGFRFQKLRACIRLLEKISASGSNRLSCGIEFLEDSFLSDETDAPKVSVEENKLYTSTLTFNSSAIKNTIVAFIDLHLRYAGDSSFSLCFFASAEIGHERPSAELLAELGIEKIKGCGILQKLCAKEALTDDEQKICHAFVLKEYREQYASGGGFLAIIGKWTIEQTMAFVNRIEWHITDEGNDELESEALEIIRCCPFFTSQHESLESFILASILDLFEKLSEKIERASRLVHTSDIKLIYTEILGDRIRLKPTDPAHQMWSQLNSSDLRNLREKIMAVTPNYYAKGLERLERRCALAKSEGEQFGKEYVSLRRRLFDVCELVLEEYLEDGQQLGNEDVNKILDEMTIRSIKRLTEMGQTFHYQIKDPDIVRGAVLSLFDECYLAFDDAP